MSDYGDDYSDYGGDEWFYVEEEFMAADDLAEHAVASPPPTTYADEDAAEDWDRFDYFNDLEYASDGYDDAVFEVQDAKDAKTGQKRKRHVKPTQSKKRQRIGNTEAAALGMSPIVWRSQAERGLQPKLLDDNAQTYTVLQDWRKKLKDTPRWARGSPPQSPTVQAVKEQQDVAETAGTAEPASPPSELEAEDEGAHEDEMDLDPGALMAALQSRLAEAGGPLSGMDPQQLLEFAMRMATGKDTGDDIAGEMADAMFDQGGEGDEEDPEAEANLLSWVAQQRNNGTEPAASAPNTTTPNDTKRPPAPPEEKTSTRASSKNVKTGQPPATSSLKRKAGEDAESEVPAKPAKKRATRTFDAPTAASQARTASSKTARGGRKK